MSILVIGHTSYLGAFLAQNLKNHDVSKHFHFIGHKNSIAQSWSEDIETVINFACDPCVKEGHFSDLDAKLAQKAKEKGAHYIMLSSRTVYGTFSLPTTLTETMLPFEDVTPYGQAKWKIEQDLIQNFENITILRPSNIFGYEYDAVKPRPTFMGMMLKSLKEQGTITFNMSPQTKRDFLPIEIFIDHLIKIVQNPKAGIYNIGAGFGTPVGDIADWVIEGYGSGTLTVSDDVIKDSFTLDMTKTNQDYNLVIPTLADIKKHCLDIGKRLSRG